MSKKIILSGMRPSGKLHLGNWAGALANWVKLQHDYQCFYMVADWHALTTEYDNTKEIKNNVREMVIDWLSCGIDPAQAVVFRQSAILEHAELHLLLSMITPIPWLERVPSYKEIQQELTGRDLSTYGFLGYPLLQTADILIYQANFVPVGMDQLPHIELSREIARRFNSFYGKTFVEPESLLTNTPKLPGVDGRKMSKSYGNCIYLSDTSELVAKKIKEMFTDPVKIRLNDPGHPQGCVVFGFHSVFDGANTQTVEQECRAGRRGCVSCKQQLRDLMEKILAPIREKRKTMEDQPELWEKVLEEGSEKARQAAQNTMREARKAMNL
ncbi:MAG: tryptophan--tRNA ligase [Elusimicrobiota bacterium]